MAHRNVKLLTGGFASRPDLSRDAYLRDRCRAELLRRLPVAGRLDMRAANPPRPAARPGAHGWPVHRDQPNDHS